MEKPFEVIRFLLLLAIMISVYALVQGAVIFPACRRAARVRGLAVSNRVVCGDIVINNVDQISGIDKRFEELIADHRNLGSTTEPSLSQTIRGFTLRGFPSLLYRGLFKPRRVPVFIKRSPESKTELTVGQGGYETVKETTWGVINPNLNGVWAVSFQESDVRLVQSNQNRELKGNLLYILPEGAGADSSALAQKLLAELEVKRFRTLMPKLFEGARAAGEPADRGGDISVEETGKERPPAGSTSVKKKKDLYS
jgi:hypothetical protein